jgi:hypothetical protein
MKYGMEVITQGLNQALTVQKGLWAQSFGLYEQSLNLREQNCQQLQSQWQQWQQQAAEQTQQQQKRVHESTEGATEVLWSLGHKPSKSGSPWSSSGSRHKRKCRSCKSRR